jgi:hypothetical protein
MALFTFCWAAPVRAICAPNFMDTARPALSSDGLTIFDPDDRRASDWLKFMLFCESWLDAFSADMLVLMTITDSFHESPLAGQMF